MRIVPFTYYYVPWLRATLFECSYYIKDGSWSSLNSLLIQKKKKMRIVPFTYYYVPWLRATLFECSYYIKDDKWKKCERKFSLCEHIAIKWHQLNRWSSEASREMSHIWLGKRLIQLGVDAY